MSPCTGRVNPAGAGGRAQQLRMLKAGRHPKTRQILAHESSRGDGTVDAQGQAELQTEVAQLNDAQRLSQTVQGRRLLRVRARLAGLPPPPTAIEKRQHGSVDGIPDVCPTIDNDGDTLIRDSPNTKRRRANAQALINAAMQPVHSHKCRLEPVQSLGAMTKNRPIISTRGERPTVGSNEDTTATDLIDRSTAKRDTVLSAQVQPPFSEKRRLLSTPLSEVARKRPRTINHPAITKSQLPSLVYRRDPNLPTNSRGAFELPDQLETTLKRSQQCSSDEESDKLYKRSRLR